MKVFTRGAKCSNRATKAARSRRVATASIKRPHAPAPVPVSPLACIAANRLVRTRRDAPPAPQQYRVRSCAARQHRESIGRNSRSLPDASCGEYRCIMRRVFDVIVYSRGVKITASDKRTCRASPADYGWSSIYPVHVMTRKSFGLMTRKLSVTESQKSAQFRGTVSRRKPSVASANWAHVA